MQAVLIAASTGGPRALETLLPDLCARAEVPIVLVQHMPAGFTHSLAEHLSRQTRRSVIEASDGEIMRPRTVYVAPGGKHLFLRAGTGGRVLTGLNEQPPENGCRPAADVLFRSAAAIPDAAAVAVVLTGMMNDGTRGLGPLKRTGAHAIAQDEATSVVWGMPGASVEIGAAIQTLPITDVGPTVTSRMSVMIRGAHHP